MKSMTPIERRILRRETHSPRSAAAVVTAIALMIVVAWLMIEGVLSLLGVRALLVSPRDLVSAFVTAPTAGTALLITVAVLSAAVGIVLLAFAMLPGRRPRRRLAAERALVVADDEMLASALARRAARTAGVAPDSVTVAVGRRRGVVRIVPVSGMRIDRDDVRQSVVDEAQSAGAEGLDRIDVLVAPAGKVGS